MMKFISFGDFHTAVIAELGSLRAFANGFASASRATFKVFEQAGKVTARGKEMEISRQGERREGGRRAAGDDAGTEKAGVSTPDSGEEGGGL